MAAESLKAGPLADQIKQDVKLKVERLVKTQDVRPCLAAVRVGDDPASAV
jgi:5,10-methylene-tetrahydrofolate dehydrogenase/methenyl tetrahydrofolate cyclohydrolase